MKTRCDFCGGRLGLISHRKGTLRFCRKAHRDAYEQRQRLNWEAEARRKTFFDFLIRGSPSR
jgi:hypothetical protein